MTSTPNGGRSSTSTTRRGSAWRRHGCTRPGERGTPARPGWARPSTSTCSKANWRCGEYLRVVADDLADTQQHGASTTWVLSNHNVVRHATRYALPAQDDLSSIGAASAWLLSGGVSPEPDCGLGTQRARAATLLMLALPGSAYLYQGEELGLHEVADIPGDRREDPVFWRSGGAEKGPRRVPRPAALDG